ncbi:hypothetical protein KVQ90_24710, partial [Escherichia coli]|nr:hypothetical protein [Escherichia coli]
MAMGIMPHVSSRTRAFLEVEAWSTCLGLAIGRRLLRRLLVHGLLVEVGAPAVITGRRLEIHRLLALLSSAPPPPPRAL